jgi:NTP pyrophosphatase (non-canonical NTP hydrolase)
MISDSTTSLAELKELVLQFRDERDWKQFHDPKNLAEAVSIEAAELLELFLWKKPEDVAALLKSDTKFKKAVEEEFADILCFILSFANAAEIDVSRAVQAKIETNRTKYPVEKARGTATKYDQL